MGRRWFYTIVLSLLAACSGGTDRAPVIVVGVDGASWETLYRYSSEGKMPHFSALLKRGSAGYVNSILWRRFEHRRRGYFSPIVWSGIATGKRPDQHGVEDFGLPMPKDRDFYLMGGAGPGVLELGLLQPGALLLEAQSAADQPVTLELRLGSRSLGRLDFDGHSAVHSFELPVEALPPGSGRLEDRAEPEGSDGPVLCIRRLGLLDAGGRLLRWLHPRQNGDEMKGAWRYTPQGPVVPAARYHLLARPFWDIASGQGRRVTVLGWWASWPAQALNGTVLSDGVSLRQKGSDAGIVEPQTLVPLVHELIQQSSGLKDTWKTELAGAFACNCLGEAQVRIYLDHRWEDELRLRLAEKLAKDKPDLTSVYFRLIDSASHQFLTFEQASQRARCAGAGCNAQQLGGMVEHSYKLLDEALGRLARVVPEDAVWLLVSDHGLFAPEGKAGQHLNNGFLVLAGPGIKPGLLFEAQVTDVAPTVLYLLGLPMASDMSGRLLVQALEPELLERRPPRWISSYEDLYAPLPETAAEVEPAVAKEQQEVLDALGYLD